MKSIIALAITLLLTGVGLTLYLPAYEPDAPIDRSIPYQIDQASLKKPYAINQTLITALAPEQDNYALQLGLFGQLDQAVAKAQKYALSENPTIIKTIDRQRYFYLLLLGPFERKSEANQTLLALMQQRQIAAKLVKWPLSSKDEKDDMQADKADDGQKVAQTPAQEKESSQ